MGLLNKHAAPIFLIIMLSHTAIAGTSIDVDNSQIEWLGKKVTGQHNGSLNLKNGEVYIEKGALTGGRFVFDMTSIKVLDIKDPKWNSKLEKHLKNDDFFATDKHPKAVFEFKEATPLKNANAEAPNYAIAGDLTIKGITHVVKFQARVDIDKKQSRAQGEIIVDRTLYGIKYKSGKFFEDIGDRAIYDDFQITFNVVTQ